MDNFTKLLNKTYRFLSYRQRSIKEVDDYLAKKKASSLDSKRIINKLKEQKFLDDFEKSIFKGLTLKELLHEKGGA